MQRLKGKKQIEQLFDEGRSIGAFPLRLVYIESALTNKVGVSVSKKHFKNAVDRNKIKRLLRLATENHLQTHLVPLKSKYCMMVLYVGKEIPKSKELDAQFTSMIERFNKKVLNEA